MRGCTAWSFLSHGGLPPVLLYLLCVFVSYSNMKGQGPVGLAKGLVQHSTSSEVASVALAVLHGLTIVPLVLLPIMQDVHLKLVIVLNCTLLLCLMAGSLVFHWMGIVKVCAGPAQPAYLHAAVKSWPAHRGMPTSCDGV